jgi:hypothetical protein
MPSRSGDAEHVSEDVDHDGDLALWGPVFEAAVVEYEVEYEEVGKLSSEEAATIAFSAISLLGAVQVGLRPPYGPADFYSPKRLDPQSFTIQLRPNGGHGGLGQQ